MKTRLPPLFQALPAVLLVLLSIPHPSSAEDWYFRPLRPEVYGKGDGGAYQDAWRRNSEIDWEAMQAGDILYVLGDHWRGYGDRGLGSIEAEGVVISGRHPDHPNEQGRFLSSAYSYDDADWSAVPGCPGLYYRENHATNKMWVEHELSGDTLRRLNPLKTKPASCSEWPEGSILVTGKRGSVRGIHWRPYGGVISGKRLYDAHGITHVRADRVSIRDLRFCLNTSAYKGAINVARGVHHLTVENCSFQLSRTGISFLEGDSDHVRIIGNLFDGGQIGILFDSTVATFDENVVKGNVFTNMNDNGWWKGGDMEVMYIQSLTGSIISDNVIDGYVGAGINFYAVQSGTIRDNVVERNFILNGSDPENVYRSKTVAFQVTGNNAGWEDLDPFAGNVFRYNVIDGVDGAGNPYPDGARGIRLKTMKPRGPDEYSWLVHNNVVAHVRGGENSHAVEISDGMSGQSDPWLVNNIFYGCDKFLKHSTWSSGPEDPGTFWRIDHNAYYPAAGRELFGFRGQEYRYRFFNAKLKGAGAISHNEYSLVQDPMFQDPVNGNFRPLRGSPCIDTGTRLPGTEGDIEGGPIIGPPDIGAYESRAEARE